MSDVTGPQLPPNAQGVSAAAPVAGGENNREGPPEERAEKEARREAEAPHAKSPAVTFAASLASLAVDEQVAGTITGIDAEGHPVFESPRGRFAIDPTAGLEAGMAAVLKITTLKPRLTAEVVARNGVPTEPPLAVTLNLVKVKGPLAPPPTDADIDELVVHYDQPRRSPTPAGEAAATQQAPSEDALTAFIVRQFTIIQTASVPSPAPPAQDAAPRPPPPATVAQSSVETAPTAPDGFDKVAKTALDIGLPITAVAMPRDAPAASPANAAAPPASAEATTLRVAPIAVTAADDLSPVAAPPPASPLAILAERGRVLTFSVVENLPAPAAGTTTAVRLRRGDIFLQLSVKAPLPAGTKITLAMLDRRLPNLAPAPAEPASTERAAAPRQTSPATPGRAADASLPASPSQAVAEPGTALPETAPAPPAHATQTSATAPPAAPLPVALFAALDRAAPQPWPVLEQLAASPIVGAAAAEGRAAQALPRPGPALTGTALFFWRALGLGSAEGWLGKAARDGAEQSGLARLWSALQRDVSLLSEAVRQQAGGEWRSHPLPLQTDSGVQLLNFLVRPATAHWVDEDGRAPDRHSVDGKREDFSLEVDFERFGRIRFSGQVGPGVLFLKVASRHALPGDLQEELREAFTAALAAGGLDGQLEYDLLR